MEPSLIHKAFKKNTWRYLFAAVPIYILYYIFAALPVRIASGLAGWLGRTLGPKLPMSRIAHLNLQYVWPHLDFPARQKIVIGMWDNYFRLFAEYPHLQDIMAGKGGQIIVHGGEYLTELGKQNKAVMVLTGHFGNWEFGPLLSAQLGLPLAIVWRPPNNPYVARLLEKGRGGATAQFRKGAQGARQIIAHLKQGKALTMVIDQKMNDGIAMPFLGKPAMMASSMADLALKYDCPLVMVRCERVKGTQFEVTIFPPQKFAPSGDRQRDMRQILIWANAELERWIETAPSQWMWLHHRWQKWPKNMVTPPAESE